jgi:hypothetical protein
MLAPPSGIFNEVLLTKILDIAVIGMRWGWNHFEGIQ